MKHGHFTHAQLRRIHACTCAPLFNGAPWAGLIVLTIAAAIGLALLLS